MHEHNKGILLMIATTFIFAMQDTLTKHLAQHMPILQFVAIRFIVFLVFAWWWTTRTRPLREVMRVKNPAIQMLRGSLLVLEILLFAYVIQHIGLGQMHSIFAAYPLIVTALSPWILGEAVGWRRWAAIAVGFIGTLIIIAPGSVAFNLYSVLALGCALMFALYNLLTRLVGMTDSAESSLFYTGLMGTALTVPLLPFIWQPIPPNLYGWLVVLCFTGIASHYLMIVALKMTPAVILQPFNYLVLPWAILLGFLVFGEIIPHHQWYGIALVVGSGVFVAVRQRRKVQDKARN